MRSKRRAHFGWSQATGTKVGPDAPAVYDLDSGSTSTAEKPPEAVGQWTGDLSSGTPNSPQSVDFLLLTETIGRLAQLPHSDPLHIDELTSRYATNLVGLMRSTFDISPPRIFPQDAEALVMTWEDSGIAKLLTIAGEEVSLLDLHKASQLRCYHDVSDGVEAMPSLIPILLQSSQARSSASED